MGRGSTVPKFGVELIMGLPGSGKSYTLVKRIIETVVNERRPVYTNAPLRWRVIRKFVRDRWGAEVAGLIRQMTREHFIAFMDRFVAKEEHVKELKRARAFKSRKQAQAEFVQRYGDDLIDDAQAAAAGAECANWIPEFAVVAIDEAQDWFPNPALKSSERVVEPRGLMLYLTMHRHAMHQVWFITQADRQVSATIKSLTEKFWLVWDKSERKLIFNIKGKTIFEPLGLRFAGVQCFTRDQWNPDRPGVPCESYGHCLSAPWNKWVFRMYASFSRGTSLAEARRVLRRYREGAGLDEDGRSAVEREALEKKAMPKKRGLINRAVRFVGRWGVRLALVVAVVAVAYGAGRGSVAPPMAEVVSGGEEVGDVVAVEQTGVDGVNMAQRISAVGRDWVRVDGKECGIGGHCNGLVLCKVDAASGRSVWTNALNHDFWVWSVGRGPQRFAPYSDTVEAITGSNAGLASGEDGAAPGAAMGSNGGEVGPWADGQDDGFGDERRGNVAPGGVEPVP